MDPCYMECRYLLIIWKALKCKPSARITGISTSNLRTPRSLAHTLYCHIKNGWPVAAIQCRKRCISATEQFQRIPHQFFDLCRPLSRWYSFQDKKLACLAPLWQCFFSLSYTLLSNAVFTTYPYWIRTWELSTWNTCTCIYTLTLTYS